MLKPQISALALAPEMPSILAIKGAGPSSRKTVCHRLQVARQLRSIDLAPHPAIATIQRYRTARVDGLTRPTTITGARTPAAKMAASIQAAEAVLRLRARSTTVRTNLVRR